ncbi:hypothetical protein PANO111632_05090 [Paracoccus nototheniae]
MPVSASAGTSAALYISPTDRPSWSASTIRTSDGGMTCASVPEAAMTPVASGLSYPYRIMIGSEISPIEMTEAATTPVVAASSAPTRITA